MASLYNREVLGEAIEARLTELEWTQGQLAKALKVAQQTVSKWIAGETVPRPGTLRRLEAALSVEQDAWMALAYEAAAARDNKGGATTAMAATAPQATDRLEAVEKGLARLERKIDRLLKEAAPSRTGRTESTR